MINKGHANGANSTRSEGTAVGSFQKKVILIIEDDEAIRETLKFALELEGYQAFTAANGQEGIDILATMPRPCLILLDLMMPVMNGWEFVEVIEKDENLSTIPIVAVTAFTDKAKTIRTQGIIKKPIDLNTLSKALEQWCNS